MHLSRPGDEDRLVSVSPATRRAYELGRLYAPASTLLVLIGGTGTGKTFFARWVHDHGPRLGRPFVAMTAMEFVDALAPTQLFGHERGAFTGADCRRAGLFERAGDGTALLDDFHLLPVSIQAQLLRALADACFLPMGAERDLPLRCRIIIGMGRCPDQMVKDGTLLADLRFRIGYAAVRLAALCDRREEIAPLAELFLAACPTTTGVAGPLRFAPDVIPVLEAASWPGNLRELRAVIEASFLHAAGDCLVRFDHLPDHVRIAPRFEPYGDAIANARAIDWALWRCKGRIDQASRLIGAHRNTLSAHVAQRRKASSAHTVEPDIVHDDTPDAASS